MSLIKESIDLEMRLLNQRKDVHIWACSNTPFDEDMKPVFGVLRMKNEPETDDYAIKAMCPRFIPYNPKTNRLDTEKAKPLMHIWLANTAAQCMALYDELMTRSIRELEETLAQKKDEQAKFRKEVMGL